MRSILAGLRSLVLPWGAPSTGPRTVLGPYVPPELVAYYAARGIVVTSAILYYTSGTNYYYDANLEQSGSLTLHGRGFSDGTAVAEYEHSWRDTSNNSVFAIIGFSEPTSVIFGESVRGNWNGDEFWRVERNARLEAVGTAPWFETAPRIGAYDPADSHPVLYGLRGVETVSMGPATSFTRNIVFSIPFPTGVIPHCQPNINSGSGTTAGWNVRGINPTETGFTIFGFGGSTTWTNIPVSWVAIA